MGERRKCGYARIFYNISKMLNVVHQENMILLSLLTGKKLDDEWLKGIEETFKEACKVDK